MKKSKILCFLLAVVMIVSMVPLSAISVSALNLNVNGKVYIATEPSEGKSVYFTPTQSGIYTIYSSNNNGNPRAFVYEDGEYIGNYDDINSYNTNFSFTLPMYKGKEYRISVAFRSNKAGTCYLNCNMLPAINCGEPYNGHIVANGSPERVTFSPEFTGLYDIYSTGSSDVAALLCSASQYLAGNYINNSIAYDENSGEDYNYYISGVELTVGEIYVLETQARDDSDTRYTINVNIKEQVPEGLSYEVSNGEVTITDYYGSATELVIPDTIDGCPVTVIGRYAFNQCYGVTSVILPDSIKKIDESAFFGSGITEITIPESVTEIGDYTFCLCSDLTSINIPKNTTTIGAGITSGCYSLASVTVASGNSVYNSNGNCIINKKTKELVAGCQSSAIPTDGSVTTIGDDAFAYFYTIESITIPEGVTSIGASAFRYCEGIASIDIPASVTFIGDSAFYGCESLTTVNYAGSETDWNNISIGYDNNDLLDANIVFLGTAHEPDFDTGIIYEIVNGEVTITDYYGIATEIVIPDTIEGYAVTEIEDYAFQLHPQITLITLPDSIERIGECAFFETGISEITIPESVTGIGDMAFGLCSELVEINIPKNVTTIGNGIISGCTSLTSVTVSSANTVYKSINDCIINKNTKTLIAGCCVSIIPTDGSVTSIGKCAFSSCYNMESITISNYISSIDDEAFAYCSSLKTITIPKSVTYIGRGAFYGSYSLSTVNYAGSETDWNNISIGYDNDALLDANIIFAEDDSGTDVTFTYNGFDCEISDGKVIITNYTPGTSNTDVVIPATINGYSVTAISDYAFSYIDTIESITISEGITSIGASAFRYCDLSSISIPKSVTTIGDGAFYECENLTTVNYAGNANEWNSITIGYDNDALTDANVIFAGTTPDPEPDDPNTYNGFGYVVSGGKVTITSYTPASSETIDVVIPSTINGYPVTAIADEAFYGCYAITSVTIPEGVTTIGRNAFAWCMGIESITLPESLTRIMDNAFEWCFNIETVNYAGSEADWDDVNIGSGNDYLTGATIYFDGINTALNGWVNEGGKWAYYENGTKLTNQWKKDSTGWCYLGADGYMLTNKWVKDSIGWCYVGANGYMVYNKWVKDSIGWCHVGTNGYMEYNKWIKDSTGWCHVGANGYMEYNKWIKDSTGWCHVGTSGYMEYNKWVRDSKGWCHVGTNGYMEYNKWIKDSTGWCHVGANGYMEYNKWIKDSAGWCYVGSTGYMVTNAWVSSGGQWYYMNASGYMVTGRQLIGGKYYTFNSSGVWVG